MILLIFSLIDLNNASFSEIKRLPICEKKAENIYLYIKIHGELSSVYDLLKIEGITIQDFEKIKDSVVIKPSRRERKDIWYIRELEKKIVSEESPSYLFVERWRSKILFPMNINRAGVYDIVSFDGVSLVDAWSIIRYVKGHEGVRSFGQMRREIEGLSYYGYRNLRPFVVFKDYNYTGYHGDVKVLLRTGTDTIFSYTRGISYFGRNFVSGYVFSYNKFRGFAGMEDKGFVEKLYLGNYRVVWAEGLVLSTVPEIKPRYYRKIEGITGDMLSVSSYSLQGFGGVFRIGEELKFYSVFSSIKRAGILNPDGTVNSYFPSYAPSEDTEEKFIENLFGTRLFYTPHSLMPFAFGVSGIFIHYDRNLRPDPSTIDLENDGYTMDDENYLYLPTGNNLVFLGFDARGVIEKHTEFWFEQAFSKEFGSAFLGRLRYQKNEGYLLLLYRDYSLKYSNPFMRGFYEQGRLDDTQVEKEYRLKKEEYSELKYLPMPKAEQGFYLEMRHQFSRNFILPKFYVDLWKNKAVGKFNFRTQGAVEYRVFYPLRIRFYQKIQSKWKETREVFTRSLLDEKSLRFLLSLGGGNFVCSEYKNTQVKVIPDPRFGNDQLLSADVLSLWWEYKRETINWEIGASVWRSNGGSSWVFEDRGIDFLEYDGFKYYIVVEQRPADYLLLRIKWRYSISYNKEVVKERKNLIEMEVNLIW